MATENEECKGLRVLDPVQGLIDYINDTKPFHTKIVEVLVEYVYDEATDITVDENFNLAVELLRPAEELKTMGCYGGYSLTPYGSPRSWPILSPNQNVAFEDYPAVNPPAGTVIAPGNRLKDLEEDDQFEMISHIDDTSGLCRIIDIGPKYFIIEESSIHGVLFQTEFSGWTSPVYTSGVPLDDDRPFNISNILPDTPSVGLVRVEVEQLINNVTLPIGHFGLKKLPGDNSGIFTVSEISFSEGSNDFYTIPLDPFSVRMGDDPYTTIHVQETLNPLSALGPNQTHGMLMRLLPIEVNKVLSYSNISNLPINTPDEGYLINDILDVSISTLDGFGVAIPGTGSFTVAGNLDKSNIFTGEWVRIQFSTANNGIYTIHDLTYNGIDDQTRIGVVERVRDTTADGTARIDIPSNMFFVDGDHSHRFSQGTPFNITGGNFQGQYMTLYSDFVNGKTRIRPSEEIMNVGKGMPVVDVLTSSTFTLARQRNLCVGCNINIVNSTSNDGMYEVVSAIYDSLTELTTVTVVEDILNPISDGEVFESSMGFIKEAGLGYSESTDFCAYHPELNIDVQFLEEFTVNGIELRLHNDLIAYNMENDDWWGFETPITTSYSPAEPLVTEDATAPAIPEQVAPPGGPALNDYWFNTTDNFLYRWDGATWVIETVIFWFNTDDGILYEWFEKIWSPVKTIYWLDETTNLFYYRTMYDRQMSTTVGDRVRVDTDWTQMFAHPPGWSDVQPAVPPSFNAHVTSWDSDPHRKHHKIIDIDTGNAENVYYLDGGNMIRRFNDGLRIERYDNTTNGSGFLDFEKPISFEITNISGNEITIEGVYDYFFESGNIIGIDIWNDTYHEMVIVGVTTTATDTLIEVSPTDIARFQGLTTKFGTIYGAVYEMPSGTPTVPTGVEQTLSYSYVDPQRIHTLTTDAVIKENFKIDWGSRYAWIITQVDSGGSTITVDDNITSYLNTNKMFITNSQGNNGEYEIVSHAFAAGETTITLNPAPPGEPPQGYLGFAQIEDTSVVNWFQFVVISANSTTNEFVVDGDATLDILNGDDIRVVGTLNDGTYTVTAAPVFGGGQTTIQVANIVNNDSGGWIEHV